MLTGTGRAVAALAVVLLVGGVVLDYPEVLAVGATCLLALLVAAGWMFLRPDVTATRRIEPERVRVGEPAHAILNIVNETTRPSPPIVATEAIADRKVLVAVPSLSGRGSTSVHYPLPTDRRGVFTVGPLTIGHADPLRLMRVTQSYTSQTTLWVHPQAHVVAPLPWGRNRDLDGITSDNSPRGGVAFHSLREYHAGDDRRFIHWRSSARLGTLLVRHQVVPSHPRMLIVLDTSAAPYTEDSFEDAVRVAASQATAAGVHGFPLEVRTTGGRVANCPGSAGGMRPVLDLLAEVSPRADDPGLSALAGIIPEEEGASLGVVTGQVGTESATMLCGIRRRFGMVTLVMVGEQFGRPAPNLRGVLAFNVRTSADFARVWAGVAST